jgi:hypothetical protein
VGNPSEVELRLRRAVQPCSVRIDLRDAQGMPTSGPTERGRSERERPEPTMGLRRLGRAFAVPSTLGAVADALIARAHLAGAVCERGPVMDLLALVVEDPDTLRALERGDTPSDRVLERMADLIAIDPPATVPEWDFLQTILQSLRFALGAPGRREAQGSESVPDP